MNGEGKDFQIQISRIMEVVETFAPPTPSPPYPPPYSLLPKKTNPSKNPESVSTNAFVIVMRSGSELGPRSDLVGGDGELVLELD